MDLTPHIEAIAADLETLLATDESVALTFERLTRPLEASLQLRLIDVLSDAALELTEQLGESSAEVRVAGRDANLVVVRVPEAPVPPPAPDDGGTARVTLRMPDALKAAMDEAAETLGESVNTWLVQAVQSKLAAPRSRRRGSTRSRISGYARS
jgi:hypothetical protein